MNAGPVASFDVGSVHFATGYAFALNGKEHNRGEFRLLAEHHY